MNKRFLLVNIITFIRVIGALLLFPIYLKYNFFGLAIAALIFSSRFLNSKGNDRRRPNCTTS